MRSLSESLSQFGKLNRSVRLFFGVTILGGILTSVWNLFFNFYILEMGFDRQFLGLINSVSALAPLILGIPIGLLSDRIGRKQAILIGLGIFSIASTLEMLVTDKHLLLIFAFLSSIGATLIFLNVAPFLMKISKPDNRTYLFSMNFGLSILAGTAGNLLASRVSSLFAAIIQAPPSSLSSYRITMLSTLSLEYLAIILLLMIKKPETQEDANQPQPIKIELPFNTINASLRKMISQPIVWKLAIVQVVLGTGTAIISPYMNLFFHDNFHASDQTLGFIFSAKSLMTGLGILFVPKLEQMFHSRIRLVVLSQFIGAISLLIAGFSHTLPLAVAGFLLGGVFMIIPIPIMNIFSMEQADEQQQATLSSVRELSWQASWSIAPYISGVLQDWKGFSPVFLLSFGATCLSAILHNAFFQTKD